MNEECYLDGTNKIVTFIPETNPVDIKMNLKIYQKYFPQNKKIDYNSLRISNIGIYSIAKPDVSSGICKLIKKVCKTGDLTITDALANVGGMTMMFAKYFKSVIACEIIPLHCEILRSNLKVYSLENVSVNCNDYMRVMRTLKQDVIFFDPPWGGREYKKEDTIDLGINNLNIACIINILIKNVKYIFLRVPYNFNYNKFMKLVSPYTKIRLYKLNPELKEKSQVLISIKNN